ncbi:hypothetical protein [uncultured Clostridium sp.]|uniref:hypothetical protein n=1 Tax=uncultured Clostridium sp. TaxID=59620 RepID=UPI0026F409A3|nr:hypothetical protein [uncultured Clostridium sp.]
MVLMYSNNSLYLFVKTFYKEKCITSEDAEMLIDELNNFGNPGLDEGFVFSLAKKVDDIEEEKPRNLLSVDKFEVTPTMSFGYAAKI